MAEFRSILPPNASQLQRDIEQAVLRRLAERPKDAIKSSHNPRLCLPQFLPELAWEWSVNEWDSAWTEAVKRDVVWASPEVHRKSGTAKAVKDVLAALGYGDATVTYRRDTAILDSVSFDDGATFSTPMQWHHYAVTLHQPISAAMAASIHARLETVAADRSVLVQVSTSVISNTFDGIAFDAGATFDETYNFSEADSVY